MKGPWMPEAEGPRVPNPSQVICSDSDRDCHRPISRFLSRREAPDETPSAFSTEAFPSYHFVPKGVATAHFVVPTL